MPVLFQSLIFICLLDFRLYPMPRWKQAAGLQGTMAFLPLLSVQPGKGFARSLGHYMRTVKVMDDFGTLTLKDESGSPCSALIGFCSFCVSVGNDVVYEAISAQLTAPSMHTVDGKHYDTWPAVAKLIQVAVTTIMGRDESQMRERERHGQKDGDFFEVLQAQLSSHASPLILTMSTKMRLPSFLFCTSPWVRATCFRWLGR